MRIRLFALVTGLAGCLAAAPGATVTVRNPLDLARPSETIVLKAAELRTLLAVDDVRKIHVQAEGSTQDLLIQAVDTNDDAVYDDFLFQADFAPKQTRVFLLTAGAVQIAPREAYKTYGRFVRERRDDFAWENDRIAHRMYGKELETWPQEPLTSSTVDVWTKRTRKLVINDWYMVDDYHKDHGEGADFYSAGKSRGDGGSGIWVDGKLYTSSNFRESRVYSVGPIRILFELTYEAWDAAGARVTEKKRISLDAGHSFDRFESRYTVAGNAANLAHALGLKKTKGAQVQPDKAKGILRSWEEVREGPSQLGMAVIVDPASVQGVAETDLDNLILTKLTAGPPNVSYAGFASTLSGDVKTLADWDRQIADYAARLRTPVEIKLK